MGKSPGLLPGAWQKSPDNLFKAGVSLRAKTSRFVWITARGVLSSWAALAENCFWAVKASSRRASILLNEMVRREISSLVAGTSRASERFWTSIWFTSWLSLRSGEVMPDG